MHFLKKVGNVVLLNHFFCPPFLQAMLSLPKMTWMPDINIKSGGEGENTTSCPKTSGQDLKISLEEN